MSSKSHLSREPQNLALRLGVNGEIKQQSNTSEMIYSVAEQIAHLSKLVTLYPGDLLLTGTPAGVGAGRGEFLAPGDTMTLDQVIVEFEPVEAA